MLISRIARFEILIILAFSILKVAWLSLRNSYIAKVYNGIPRDTNAENNRQGR